MATRETKKATYKLQVDLTKSCKALLATVETKQFEETLVSYVKLMKPEGEEETMEISKEILSQMAVFAAQSMSRHLVERYKNE